MRRIVSFALVGLAGCTTWPDRPLITAALQAHAHIDGYQDIRYWADAPLTDWAAWRNRWIAERAVAAPGSPIDVLAISSGSDQGAFAAGFLKGWSDRGTKPAFAVVTGVSTGAMIAPFAFLGAGSDPIIEHMFTSIGAHDVFRATPISGLLGGPALAQTKPLQTMIASYVDDALLDRIAVEHHRGRRLLVMTTNLDAGRGMVWDMGAIAASGRPDRVALFRQIVLASASMPGAFPPVLVDVTSDGRRFSEMHVDGATVGSVFVLPTAVLWQDEPTGQIPDMRFSITLLYNGVLQRTYETVKPRTFGIISRALTTVIGEGNRESVQTYRAFADRFGIPLRVEAIGGDFAIKEKRSFEAPFMKALFDYGRQRGAQIPAPRPAAVATGVR